MFSKIIETQSFVHSFAIRDKIFLLSSNTIRIYSKTSFDLERENQIFEQDGLARSLIVDDDYVYCKDFIHLYVIKKHSLKIVKKIRIGDDLKSDICGMCLDEKIVYIGIRNGAIVKIEKGNWDNIQYYPVTESSIWDMKYRDGAVYAGNVDGQLLCVDANSMKIEKKIQAHKGNTKSIHIFNSNLVTAAQDKKLILWNLEDLEIIETRKNAHKKAFIVSDYYQGKIITVSFPCGELKLWNSESLAEEGTIHINGCLTGSAVIDRSYLYIASRAIKGVERASMNDILK